MTKLGKVLVVDASRTVRASLTRHLRGGFNVVEEGDAESAWQSLVLDSSIVAVLSGIDIATLEGAGIVERMRASKLARLNRMPFFLLASDSLSDAERERALDIGVSDFVPKSSAGRAIAHLFSKLAEPAEGKLGSQSESDIDIIGAAESARQSDVGLGDFMSKMVRLAALSESALIGENAIEEPSINVHEQRIPDVTAHRCLQDSLTGADEKPVAGVLVFGLDDYHGLWKRHGREVADKIVVKLSGLLAEKIRGEESIIQLADGRIAIISPTAGREQCANFAWRVCKALAAAHLSLRGERVETTVSAGVAAVPDDGADTSMPDLLRLATSRLDAAVRAGGNQVVFGKKERRNSLNQEEFIERMKDLLASASPEAMMSCKTWLSSICSTCRDRRKAGKSSPCVLGDKHGGCSRGGAAHC